MPSIHYVWWGNPGSPQLEQNATATPNLMVDLVEGTHDVHYWIGGNHGFTAPLNSRIIQHNIGANPGQLLEGTELGSYATRFAGILQALDQFRAFAATKDLVSFAVLYKHAGYFFDTTTQIGKGYQKYIRKLLSDNREPHAPYNGLEGTGKWFVPDDESAKMTVDFGSTNTSSNTPRAEWVPNFDVWALYSPKSDHAVFSRVLKSYITRAENVGFLAPNTTTVETFGTKTLQEIMNTVATAEQKADRSFKYRRDMIIGGLSISSLLQGFYDYAKSQVKDIKELGWPYVELNRGFQEGILKAAGSTADSKPELVEQATRVANSVFDGMGNASVTIPMIGIQKWYSGSWRSKNL